jgi:glycosyltransferase involved in cell wall biosynthesis
MKIAFWHFYTFRMLRGIETLVVSLANALARQNAEVSLITARPTIRPLVLPDPLVKVHAYPTGSYFEHRTIVPFYVYHCLRHRYDHVVVFFADFGEGPAWRIVNQFVDLPLTLYLCYPYSSVPHRYRSFLRWGWDQKARHILADASWIAREANELFRRPVSVVPVGTDPERFQPNSSRRDALRRQWGYADSDVVLLNVSALDRRKGTWRVLQTMGRLRDHFPNLRYFILGQGEDEPELRKTVDGLGLNGIVTFGGVTRQLEAYYNMADIFVMLPDAEGNSVACQEAMSCALPVVASNTEGFVESVPGEAGLLVDPNHPERIDEALTRLVCDASLRATRGCAGRNHVLANYSWDRIAERFLAILT